MHFLNLDGDFFKITITIFRPRLFTFIFWGWTFMISVNFLCSPTLVNSSDSFWDWNLLFFERSSDFFCLRHFFDLLGFLKIEVTILWSRALANFSRFGHFLMIEDTLFINHTLYRFLGPYFLSDHAHFLMISSALSNFFQDRFFASPFHSFADHSKVNIR